MQFLAVCPPNSKNSFFVFVGALALVHFLFHVALPWKMIHQAQRSNSWEALDMAWVCALPWFAVTDKYNYKEMCAVVTAVQCGLDSDTAAVLRMYRTLSLRGNNGSNVAKDYGNEKQNKEMADFTRGKLDRVNGLELLKEASLILNGSKDVQYKARKAFGFGTASASTSSMVLDEDVEPLVKAMKEKVGSSWEEWSCVKQGNKFGRKSSQTVINSYKEWSGTPKATTYVSEAISRNNLD